MEQTETTVELAEIQPDALMVGTRPLELPPVVGQPSWKGYTQESIRLARYGAIVTLTIQGTGPLDGDVRPFIGADSEAAEVHFVRMRETLRRDGWTLTEVALPQTEEAPF